MRLENASRGRTRGDNSLASQVFFYLFLCLQTIVFRNSPRKHRLYAIPPCLYVILLLLTLIILTYYYRVQVVCWAHLLATATNTTSTSETSVTYVVVFILTCHSLLLYRLLISRINSILFHTWYIFSPNFAQFLVFYTIFRI